MEDAKPTQKLELDESEMLEAGRQFQDRKFGTTGRLGKSREVLLLIDSGIRRISLRNDTSFLLGRFSKSSPSGNYIDLSPFGAQERGVSRIHAQIHMDDDILYVTDMDSTNGTYLDGIKIQPHQAEKLRQGSELLLARMHIQILYKTKTYKTEPLIDV